MKVEKFIYIPRVIVTFTKEDVGLMIVEAQRHYDSSCRLTAESGGLLAIMMNFMTFTERDIDTTSLSLHDVDLLSKVTEQLYATPCNETLREIHLKLGQLHTKMNAEFDLNIG